jgi:hypothetical protein
LDKPPKITAAAENVRFSCSEPQPSEPPRAPLQPPQFYVKDSCSSSVMPTIVAFPAINYALCQLWPLSHSSIVYFSRRLLATHIFYVAPAYFKTVVFALILLSPNRSRKATEMKQETRQYFGSYIYLGKNTTYQGCHKSKNSSTGNNIPTIQWGKKCSITYNTQDVQMTSTTAGSFSIPAGRNLELTRPTASHIAQTQKK